MPSFLSRSFSSRKKDAQKTTESDSNLVSQSTSRFKILPSRSASRPPSSSSAVDGGASRMRSLLARTPTATRTESRGGENNPTASKPLQQPGGALDGGVVGTRVDDHPVSSGNSKPNQLSAPIRGPSPQRGSSTPNPQHGLSQANRHTSLFPPSRTPQQDYQQQLRRSTASPPIPSRGPSRGPSPYNGPYPSVQNHNQWPTPFNPIDNAESFSVVDFYSRQGTPKLRNPSRNSTRNYPRSQSLTSESAGHYPVDQTEGFADLTPPSRSLKGPHLEPGEKRSSQNMRNSNSNIAGVMLGNRGPGGMGMGMGMAGLDGGLNPDMGPGNIQRRGGNIPPMPRIPSMYKPSAQSVRNQNQMMDSNNYSQYPPAFRNGKPRNNQGQDGQVSPLYPDFEVQVALQNPMDRAQPPRMQSPRHFQPPHRPHSTGPRGPDMGPQSQDRRLPKTMSGIVNGHRNPALTLLQSSVNPSAADNRSLSRRPQQPQQQPTIPTALPTPSLTPTPPSRSNSNEDRQNSDEESLIDEGLEIPHKSRPVSEANSVRTYGQWQDNGQNHGYFRRPPPYQILDPQHHMHSTSPSSPISAPATPATSSSASSTHGSSNQNHVITRQIQVSAPIMPGPVKEICYTKDINLVMEECMMGHGRAGRDNVMRRTANWQHRVGCMMCGDNGGPGEGKVEPGQTMAGKHWLWLCSWCALRVCADCRCRLGDEEDRLREKRGPGGTLKVNLTALRSKIIEEKTREQKRKSADVIEISSFEEQAERLIESPRENLERQEVDKEVPKTKIAAPPVNSETQKVDIVRGESSLIIKQNRTLSPAPVPVRPVKSTGRPSPPVSTSSEASVNSFTTAGSRVDLNGSHIIANSEEIQNKKTEHPPRVSSRNLPTEIKVDEVVFDKEQVISPQPLEVKKKQAEVLLPPKALPIQTSAKTAINGSTKTTIIVSSPVITSPKSPESPSQKTLSSSTTVASTALQAAVMDAPKEDKTAATATFAPPLRGDSSLRAVVSHEMLALITGIPIAEQPKSKPAPAVPAKPQSSARDLAEAFMPPPVPAKSPPPSRGATISQPPKSSSSTLLAPIVQVKSFISSHSSPPQPQNTVKHKPTTPASPNSLPTVERFVLPPLSFESEISNEIDNIFSTRQYTAPKAQATHAEEAYRHEAVTSSKGGRRWYKGLFGGRK